MISNCGSDERGRLTGGQPGDQTGGEWRVRSWYNRPWNCVLRHPDANVRAEIAKLARAAALNDLVGYCQGHRSTYYIHLKASNWDPAQITIACEADCSSGVAANVIAVGHRLGIKALQNVSYSLTTRGIRAAFRNAGFAVLTASKYLTGDSQLLPGDILLNDQNHVATNLDRGGNATDTSTGSGSVSAGNWIARLQSECNVQGFSNQAVDGDPGPNTLKGCPLLRKGDKGNITRLLQEKLISLGFSCGSSGADGDFGNATAAAVKTYQLANGLTADGVVGAKTWSKLLGLS